MTNSFLISVLLTGAGATLDPWSLVMNAGWVVKAVMLILLTFSVISWTVILSKYFALRAAAKMNQSFAEAFWNSGSIDSAVKATKSHSGSALARIFETGLHEFNQITALKMSRGDSLDLLESNVSRALDKATSIESETYKKYLGFLANTASAAPFIGLFGTVWGIMNSFIGIGTTGATNLTAVAPGIAEALIATAIGLFAAIPAVLFYNYFMGTIRHLNTSMNSFSTDFLNTAKRSL